MREKCSISQDQILLFAEATGDPNPIHREAKAAQEMGLEGPIAHGMFVYSYLLRRLDDWIDLERKKNPSRAWVLQSTKCRFHDPALIGEDFESVLDVHEMNDTEAKIDLTLMNRNGKRLTHVIARLVRM